MHPLYAASIGLPVNAGPLDLPEEIDLDVEDVIEEVADEHA